MSEDSGIRKSTPANFRNTYLGLVKAAAVAFALRDPAAPLSTWTSGGGTLITNRKENQLKQRRSHTSKNYEPLRQQLFRKSRKEKLENSLEIATKQ